jgi:cinnamyl-alcohol dehydrogenase
LPVLRIVAENLSLAGSQIGGIKQTQEMLEFCAEKGITAAYELVSMDYLNTAMERLGKADVRYRFVLDIKNTLKVDA